MISKILPGTHCVSKERIAAVKDMSHRFFCVQGAPFMAKALLYVYGIELPQNAKNDHKFISSLNGHGYWRTEKETIF